MNGTINELKQGLLKCANENEGVIYLAEQVDISSICKDANNTIERLEQCKETLRRNRFFGVFDIIEYMWN